MLVWGPVVHVYVHSGSVYREDAQATMKLYRHLVENHPSEIATVKEWTEIFNHWIVGRGVENIIHKWDLIVLPPQAGEWNYLQVVQATRWQNPMPWECSRPTTTKACNLQIFWKLAGEISNWTRNLQNCSTFWQWSSIHGHFWTSSSSYDRCVLILNPKHSHLPKLCPGEKGLCCSLRVMQVNIS